MQLISLDRNKHSIYIHREKKLTIMRSIMEKDADDPYFAAAAREQQLLEWFAAMKDLGVNFTILN